MKHTIIIPTYNEAENIEKIISAIFKSNPEVYVLVIDDNSPDGTANKVKNLETKYPKISLLSRPKKEGLGKAYIEGFKKVMSGDSTHLFMMDADFSHDPKYLTQMIKESNLCGLVIGSRYIKGGKTEGWELWRRILSRLGNIYARIITGMPVNDMTGGFNCISLEDLRKIDLDSFSNSGYAFIMELKYRLNKSGAKIKEIPITFVNRLGGESKISNNIINEGILAPWKMRLK